MFLCGCLETWKLCCLEEEGMQQWNKLERNTQSWDSPPPSQLYSSKHQEARSLALPSSSFACTCPGCSSHGRTLASSGDSWSGCSPTSAAPVLSSLQIVSGVAEIGWWRDFKTVSLKQSETARKRSCSFACVYTFLVLLYLFFISEINLRQPLWESKVYELELHNPLKQQLMMHTFWGSQNLVCQKKCFSYSLAYWTINLTKPEIQLILS